MKQFELKFYREWYDALSELSREDRAAAALALLDYVYSDEIPTDQFIRVVTTLMRNRIDREKSLHFRRQSPDSPESQKASEITEASESSESSEFSKEECASSQSGSVVEPLGETVPSSEECSVGEPLGETSPTSDPEIDSFIQAHFSPQSASFLRLCSVRSLNPDAAAHHARRFLQDWRAQNPGLPLPAPLRIPQTQMAPIDSFIIEKAKT